MQTKKGKCTPKQSSLQPVRESLGGGGGISTPYLSSLLLFLLFLLLLLIVTCSSHQVSPSVLNIEQQSKEEVKVMARQKGGSSDHHTWKCSQCGQSASQLNVETTHGTHRAHEWLCQGRAMVPSLEGDDRNNNTSTASTTTGGDCYQGTYLGLPDHCLVCNLPLPAWTSPKISQQHYNSAHGIKLNSSHTLFNLRAKYQAHLLPTIDMHASYGLFFTRRALSPSLQEQLLEDARQPYSSATQNSSTLIDKYVECFG